MLDPAPAAKTKNPSPEAGDGFLIGSDAYESNLPPPAPRQNMAGHFVQTAHFGSRIGFKVSDVMELPDFKASSSRVNPENDLRTEVD